MGKQVFLPSSRAWELVPDDRHDPLALLFSGQAHTWQEEGDAYQLISGDHCLRFQALPASGEAGGGPARDPDAGPPPSAGASSTADMTRGRTLRLPPMDEETAAFWNRYFAFDPADDLPLEDLNQDPVFRQIYPQVSYIRILRQDPYETLIQYILSANNNMPRIRRSLDLLRHCYGERREDSQGTFYQLPGPEKLAALKPEDLRSHCGTGYRDQALVRLGQAIQAGDFSPEEAGQLDDEALYKELLSLYGVGDKVAQCIMLFAYGRLSAFPVDVWVEKVMKEFYPVADMTRKGMAVFARARYGPYAGYMQQLLFEYVRKQK